MRSDSDGNRYVYVLRTGVRGQETEKDSKGREVGLRGFGYTSLIRRLSPGGRIPGWVAVPVGTRVNRFSWGCLVLVVASLTLRRSFMYGVCACAGPLNYSEQAENLVN